MPPIADKTNPCLKRYLEEAIGLQISGSHSPPFVIYMAVIRYSCTAVQSTKSKMGSLFYAVAATGGGLPGYKCARSLVSLLIPSWVPAARTLAGIVLRSEWHQPCAAFGGRQAWDTIRFFSLFFGVFQSCWWNHMHAGQEYAESVRRECILPALFVLRFWMLSTLG